MKTEVAEQEATQFFPCDRQALFNELGKEKLLDALRKMLYVRNMEVRAESAYQQGKVGGFFHSYMGQEAIQTALVDACGKENWFSTTYRCHALALLLGVTPNEFMAELYGRATGNAKGRGGSMHFYTDRLLGGFGIVGGQVPVAIGAAFSLKHQKNRDEVSFCFLGDGAVAQGALHESLNLASLWDLPCIIVIENNQWGMGTGVNRALSVKRLAEEKASGYGMEGYTFDGMDYLNCYAGFKKLFAEVKETQRPVLVEAVTHRFRGHSISDPGLYRSKEELQHIMERGPIVKLRDMMKEHGFIDDDAFKALDKVQRQIAVEAMKYADEAPWPDLVTLEEGVLAP
jgi:pyruvate dehydrogenase E1 component alpha subunit